MLTNRPNCFQKMSTVVSGLIDFHKMIISCLKTTFKKVPPKKIIFRDYKKFDEQNFLYDLHRQMIKEKFYKEKNIYESFWDTFKAIVNKHAPLKENIVKGNNPTFLTNELRKAIMHRSRLKKKYQYWLSRENFKKLGKNRKINVIDFAEKLNRTILRISRKAIWAVAIGFGSL